MQTPASFLFLALLTALPLRAEKPNPVKWAPFTEGVQNAISKGKYVFVDVYADWCGYCKQLDLVTFRAPTVVAELDKNFVSVKLDSDGETPVVWKGHKMTSRELASLWRIDGLPTMIFINPKGEIVGSYSSYAEPDLMAKLLTYISSGARERKVSFDDYLKGAG